MKIEAIRPGSKGIGTKLLASFTLLVAISFLVVIVAQAGLSRLRQGQTEVHEEALPALREAHHLEVEFAQLVARALELSAVESVEELDAAEKELNLRFDTLLGSAAGSRLMESERGKGRLRAILTQLGDNLEQRTAAQRELLVSTASLDLGLEQGRGWASRVIDLVDPPLLRLGDPSGESTRGLRGIRSAGQAILVLLRSLNDVSELSGVDELEASYASYLADAALDALEVREPDVFKAELGMTLASLLELSESDTPVFDLRRRKIAAADRLERLEGESAGLLKSLSEATAEWKERSETNLARAAASATGAMKETTRATYLLWAVLLLAAAWILYTYVFGNVIRRLGLLSAEIRRLSEGDFSGEVTVTGSDELTEMARAAEVGRNTSLKLSQVTEELRSRNSELQEFAYVASHDLKSPLRAIHNLANWIEEDNQDTLSGESREHLRLLQQRAGKMENLLEDLLQYSRLGNVTKLVETLTLSEIVQAAVVLRDDHESFTVELVSPDLVFSAPRPPIEMILRNLINNAILHHDGREGRVEVSGGRTSRESLWLRVRDDGPGIDPERREEAFRMFSSLGAQGQGSGMGLAFVRRAASALGGTAEIEDVEGGGASLLVRLPFESKTEEEVLAEMKAAR